MALDSKPSRERLILPRVFTDGSCIGKKGGYGIVSHLGEFHGPVQGETTNQRAELIAIFMALSNVPGDMEIITDSEYSIKSLTVWYTAWERNGFKNAKGKPVMNLDIIQPIKVLMRGRRVKFTHVYGHRGHPGNERADGLARLGQKMAV